jgi:hypothetical protein
MLSMLGSFTATDVAQLLGTAAAWAKHLDELVMDTPEDQELVRKLRALLPEKWEPAVAEIQDRILAKAEDQR